MLPEPEPTTNGKPAALNPLDAVLTSKFPDVSSRIRSLPPVTHAIGNNVPVPAFVALNAATVDSQARVKYDALFASEEFKRLKADVVEVPFGRTINLVAPSVVLV